MKKLLIISLLFSVFANAQIVNIPDANFKAKLIALGIDTSSDGNIQQSEASLIISINIENLNISDLTGIQSFTNMLQLVCSSNQLTSLDVSGLTNLEVLDCGNNQLTNLNIIGCNNLVALRCSSNFISGTFNISNHNQLTELYIDNNNFSSINTSNCINLGFIDFYNNPLLTSLNTTNCNNLQNLSMHGVNIINSFPNLVSVNISNCPLLSIFQLIQSPLNSINVSGCVGLIRLEIYDAELTTLNLTGLINLEVLDCSINQLTLLNLTGCHNLIALACYNNQISSLDFSDNLFLVELYFNNNPPLQSIDASGCAALTNIYANGFQNLNSLNISGCTSLTNLNCSNSAITNLNLNACLNLATVDCSNNQISILEVSNLISLSVFNISLNQLTTLDVSTNKNLTDLNVLGNPLISIFAKNSSNEYINFGNIPNLNFICADETQVAVIQTQLDSANMSNTVCNSFCTFTPGGNYNTITGNVKLDTNNDGCDTLDNSQAFVRLNVNNGTNTNAVFTNSLGNYNRYVYTGNYTITPVLENQLNFSVSPANASVSFPNNNDNVATQNFCLSPIAPFIDAEIVISPITPARPGFDAKYLITYKNKGNVPITGQLSFNYNDTVLDLISPAFQSPGEIIFTYTNLLPLESRSFYITLNVNSPTETPAVNIGDILNFSATINTTLSDEIPNDNIFTYKQTVVGSYDPNDITCIEGESVAASEIGNYLHYVINFENTGTFQAENIVVKTTIDPNQFDINSLQLLSASNPIDARITGNVVEFIFHQIMLDTGGHGNVLLKVKSKNNLQQGDIVSKRADIFFDYNAPIDTGIANTTFQSLNNTIFNADNSISIYPNPANSIVNIIANSNLKSIQLYDVQGRILQTKIVNQTTENLDISNQSKGIYFLKITSDDGVKVEQIVKE